MAAPYLIPTATVTAEQTIKQSRFVCYLGHGASIPKILVELDQIRTLHPKADHVCSAYIAGPPTTSDKGSSDDGEPRGTAGRPMLNLLEHAGYGEIWTAVVRYFGGIKLGKGGLVRAYTSSVQTGLRLVKTRTRQSLLHCRLLLDSNLLPVIEQLCNRYTVEIVERYYREQVEVEMQIPESMVAEFQSEIGRVSSARIKLSFPQDTSHQG